MEVTEDLAEAGPAVGAAPAASQSADVFFCSTHHVEAERSISLLMDAQSLHLHSLLTDCCCCGLECVFSFFFFFTPLRLPGSDASKSALPCVFINNRKPTLSDPIVSRGEVKANTVSMAFYFLKMQLHKRFYCLLLVPRMKANPHIYPPLVSKSALLMRSEAAAGMSLIPTAGK